MANPFFEAQPSHDEVEERIEGYPSWFEVDLDAIGHNLDQIRKQVQVEVIPCVKNNAYGHGLVPIVAFLERQGIGRVLVAKLWEALRLRSAGINIGIINMDPLFSEERVKVVVEQEITQTVYTKTAADELNEAASQLGKIAKVFVKVDTGLRRIGVRHDKAANLVEYISGLPNTQVDGVFSTFTQNDAQDRVQLTRLREVAGELERRGVDPGVMSMASSDAILHFSDAHLDAVRPGMILYGIHPSEEDEESDIELRQALAFKARLEHTKWIEEGDSLTYWGRYTAPKRMRVGTLHVGFFDGLPRELANRGRVKVQQEFKSILGSVSLNHVVIDLTGVNADVGDIVEVVGREGENTIGNIARLSGWMTYSLLNHLNPMTPRVYHEEGIPVALLEPQSLVTEFASHPTP